ncbi:GFA family protein [Aurantiacibacter sp. MUD11]|uniref:GFA family protein n=1 Tax=Aurantiacibacter sp. MUD11 TaxID=3003265 RepID=UPI0022AACDF3|nr:GFA family protein [Aurantiacibacter sp. MUD11]WAT18676.1 GFA family protein [Aurantiacibacter sp. MUD11]
MADATMSGGCLCGEIRYEITPPAAFVSQCCCKDCQKATGTGHATILGIHKDQLALNGSLATYTNVGETGGKVTRHFCGTCAGRIYTSGDLPGDMIMVQAGSLDDPAQVTPQNAIYVKDRIPWDKLDPDIPHFEGMPATPTG